MQEKTGSLTRLNEANYRLKHLGKVLKQMDSAVVAFSGGLDSSFLLWACSTVLDRGSVKAVTFQSDTTPAQEIERAVETAACLGIEHLILSSPEVQNEDFLRNDLLRCYYCKRERFAFLCAQKDFQASLIIEGSQMDDLNEYRPGMKAVREFNIRSPLIEAQINRQDIELLTKDWSLPFSNQKSESCLATRIKTGQPIKISDLQMIDRAEAYIKSLGASFVRVRLNQGEARLELLPEDMRIIWEKRESIVNYLKVLGLNRIALDLEGYKKQLKEVSGYE